jgi:hypothetical protein
LRLRGSLQESKYLNEIAKSPMRPLLPAEASKILTARGLKIGNWNELAQVNPDGGASRQCVVPSEVRLLFSFCQDLLSWLSPQSSAWFLLQIDDSTAPLRSEMAAFQFLAMPGNERWDGDQRTFMIEMGEKEGRNVGEKSRLTMLVFFALAFEWHIHLTCEKAVDGQWLGLLDGIAYLFGPQSTIERFG